MHLFTKTFALEFYLLLSFKFLSSTLGVGRRWRKGRRRRTVPFTTFYR